MNSSYEVLIVTILTLIFGITARFLLSKLRHTSRPALRFGLMAGLFLLYTLVLMLMLNRVYLSMLHINADIREYHRAVITTLCAVNTVVIFTALLYQSVRGKHRLSGDDKMKLMDL